MNVDTLESSFALLAPHADELVRVFYEDLFAAAPSVRPLFPESIDEQKKKLVAALAWVVGNLRKPDAFRTGLLAMGQRHIAYGAEPAHYPAVRDVLLGAMAKMAGEVWTPELEQEWREALNAVAGVMLEGAAGQSMAA